MSIRQDKIDAFFRDKWNHGPCPVCQTDSWQIGGDIGEIPVSDMYATDIMSAGTIYPVFPVFCTNCGYTLLFNANIAGLGFDPPTAEASGEA